MKLEVAPVVDVTVPLVDNEVPVVSPEKLVVDGLVTMDEVKIVVVDDVEEGGNPLTDEEDEMVEVTTLVVDESITEVRVPVVSSVVEVVEDAVEDDAVALVVAC